jgi:hypothetical protein
MRASSRQRDHGITTSRPKRGLGRPATIMDNVCTKIQIRQGSKIHTVRTPVRADLRIHEKVT